MSAKLKYRTIKRMGMGMCTYFANPTAALPGLEYAGAESQLVRVVKQQMSFEVAGENLTFLEQGRIGEKVSQILLVCVVR